MRPLLLPAPQTDFKARAFRFYKKAMRIATWGMDQDVFDAVRTDERVKELHETAEVFDPKCEYVFAYLQVRDMCSKAQCTQHAAN